MRLTVYTDYALRVLMYLAVKTDWRQSTRSRRATAFPGTT